MAFPRIPTEPRNQIDNAGHVLVSDSISSDRYRHALQLANRWRAAHAYPINTFQATLRSKLRNYPNEPIAAQRLKRMPTIIDKLKRYRNMHLTTMNDIGGVRAILDSITDVYNLADEYRSSKRLAHNLINEYDYIANPRDEDGYRSLHLVYKYKNKLCPMYDGLRLELQIRTKLQHTWATAVEAMGTILGQSLKSRQGDQDWLDFFAYVAASFAFIEKSQQINRFRQYTQMDIAHKISELETRLAALEKIQQLSKAIEHIVNLRAKGKSWFYHVIVLDSQNASVEVRSYDRSDFITAEQEYIAYETRASGGERIEPVLVSAGPIEQLKRAYPNFFLDMGEFYILVNKIIAGVRS